MLVKNSGTRYYFTRLLLPACRLADCRRLKPEWAYLAEKLVKAESHFSKTRYFSRPIHTGV